MVDLSEQKSTILIIEDDNSLSEVIKQALEQKGYTIYQSYDGEDGIEIALKYHPNVILLDIIMPKKDGIETLNQLRKDSWGSSVPIVMLSNLNDSQRIKEAADSHANAYLIKAECTLEQIIEKVLELSSYSQT